jgi:hypothetical protein
MLIVTEKESPPDPEKGTGVHEDARLPNSEDYPAGIIPQNAEQVKRKPRAN